MAKFFLRKKAGSRIVDGHPWVFANEIGDNDGGSQPGDIVEVYSYSGTFIGKGFVNPASQIRIRLLSTDKAEEIDTQFFYKKIKQAWEYRQKLGYKENYRLVYGEADGLPGLVIDKYNEYLVVQSLALGMDRYIPGIEAVLTELFSPKGIYLRNDNPIRNLEKAPLEKQFLSEPFDTDITIQENGLSFKADIANGHRMGYYLDQHINRRYLEHISKGAEALDVFCYTGSFGIHAAMYGAKSVTGIDTDKEAVLLANTNAELNNVADICQFETSNAFDALKAYIRIGRQYDIVILDPPSMATGKQGLSKAKAAYKELNLRAMKLLKTGGYLITCSSTNLLADDEFREILQEAAKDAGRHLRQVIAQTQSPDHPVVWSIPTTAYLKFFMLRVT